MPQETPISLLLRSRLAAPLHGRDFRLFWSANLVSLLGDGVFTVALALEALQLDRSPSGLAYVLAARTVPLVGLSLLGGVVADRVARRTALLVADGVRGGAVAVIAVLAAAHGASLLALVLMAVVFGTADAFAEPAFLALLPEIVPDAMLVQANALNSTSSELAMNLVGPAIGGAVVGLLGISGAFLLDAATFGGSAAFIAGIRWRTRPEGSHGSMLAEALDGLRYIGSRR